MEGEKEGKEGEEKNITGELKMNKKYGPLSIKH